MGNNDEEGGLPNVLTKTRALKKTKSEFNWHNFLVVLGVSLGQFVFGYPSSVISVILNNEHWLEYTGLATNPNKSGLIGATNGVYQAGAVVTIPLTQWIMDKYGRKICGYYLSVLAIFAGALLTGTQNIAMFIVARGFMGAAAFGFLILTPVYTTELSPPSLRGFFSGLNGLNISFAYGIAGWVGNGFFYADSPAATWRGPLGIFLIFPFAMILILFFSPESPRFLLMKGRTEEARKVTFRLHTVKGDESYAQDEFREMSEQAEMDRTSNASWWSLVADPAYRKRTAIACFYCFLGQSTGVLVINNYGPIFYEQLGYPPAKQLTFQSGWLSLGPPFCLIGALLMDRMGRRFWMITGIAGCCGSLIVETIAGAYLPSPAMGKLGVASFYVFLAFYSVGVDVGGNVFYAEIYPNHIRAKGVALVNIVLALADLVYLQVTDLAIENIQWRFFLVFVILSGLGAITLYFTLPETKGVPLEEMGRIFGDKDMAVHHDRNESSSGSMEDNEKNGVQGKESANTKAVS